MNRNNMHQYQNKSVWYIIQNYFCGLFLGMGLGKTVSTLTAIDILLFDMFDVNKVLIIAPKKVAEETWKTEISKWEHLKHLRLSVVVGTEKERKEALKVKADIWIINRENVAWLVSMYGGAWPFDMVVIDELSSFKNHQAVRFKALRQMRPKMKRVVGLTGTPAPNGLLDLWPQLYLLDQGERLGKTITDYRNKFFTKNPHSTFGKYEVHRDGDSEIGYGHYEKKIYGKIGDICISMEAKDYLELPKRIDRINEITLPAAVQKAYDDFERDLVMSITTGEEITAVNAAVLTGKLLQFSNGAIYDAERKVHEVHDCKLEALAEDMEAANGKPVLIFYNFQHDLERIQRHFKQYKPVLLKGEKDIVAWNKRQIPMLLAHPASAGHGLNLQAGGNLIEWFGSGFSLELDLQAIARLDRQGQKFPVINTRLVCKNTIDEYVLQALTNKDKTQSALMNAVKALVNKYQ